jgi:hypothetical protein
MLQQLMKQLQLTEKIERDLNQQQLNQVKSGIFSARLANDY